MPTCVRCGCTDNNACVVKGVPRHWASEDPPICSACIVGAEELLDVGAAGVLGDEGFGCPVSPQGVHQPLFRGDGSAYCIHCRDAIAAA